MIKNPTAKYWKQIHHARKDSADSLNDSVGSNHSSLSSGYNRFKFQPKPSSPDKRNTLFQFTARNRDQPFDVSVLSKRSDKAQVRKSLDIQLPVRDPLFRFDSYKDQLSTPRVVNQPSKDAGVGSKPKALPVKDIARQLKFLTNSLKRTIDYFARQLKELKIEWDFSISQLLKHHISFENSAITQLRDCLEQKEKEIQKFKQDFVKIDKKITNKEAFSKIRQAQSINDEVSLSKLAISHIQPSKTNEIDNQLSRNNTINSLLGDYRNSPKVNHAGRQSSELFCLKQALKRMREVLYSGE